MRKELFASTTDPPAGFQKTLFQSSEEHQRLKVFKKPTFHLSCSADLARTLGLAPGASAAAISQAFIRATAYEAQLEVVEENILKVASESWEVRIVRALPHCRVSLRQGSRGSWKHTADEIPDDVLCFLGVREARDGGLVCARPWRVWQRMNWTGLGGRRLRSRSGELIASFMLGEVRRPTGEVRRSLVISALGAPYPDLLKPMRLALPISVSQLVGAVSHIREVSASQIDMVA